MQITHQRGSNTQGSPRRDASATRAFRMIDIILHSRSCEMLSDDSFSSEKIKPSDCSLDIRATNRIGDHGRRRSYLRISLCPDQIFSRPNDSRALRRTVHRLFRFRGNDLWTNRSVASHQRSNQMVDVYNCTYDSRKSISRCPSI